jgi:site-specific DNA recombinase
MRKLKKTKKRSKKIKAHPTMKENEMLLKQFAKGQIERKKSSSGQNCVIYTRVSSKEQAETNQSLEWQKKYCLDYATKNNLTIQGYFGGTYESAKSDERKEFSRMLKFVKGCKEKISFILVYSLDRFSRTGDSAIYISSELKKTGVNIMAVTQPIDTNSHAGALQQNIQFIFSKYDNDLRRQKSIDGMREKLLRGEWLGNCPTGYAYDRTHGGKEQKIVISEKGPLIRQAFIWRSEGLTYEEIITRLVDMGLKLPNQTLTDVFRNPFYIGFISHNFLGGELVKGKHEPLIDEDLFLRANQLRKTGGYKIKLSNENLPLKRFVKEAETGFPFTGYIVKKKNKYYYKVNEPGIRINRSTVLMHGKFREILHEYTIEKKWIEPLKLQLQYTWDNLTESNSDLKKSLSLKMNEIEAKMEKLEERHAFGEIGQDIYHKFTSKLLEERKALSVELEDLSSQLSNPKSLIDFTCHLASDLAPVWDSSDYHQKQRVQYLLFPDGIRYDVKIEHYRTPKINSVFEAMAYFSKSCGENKSGSSDFFLGNSRSVPGTGVEPLI